MRFTRSLFGRTKVLNYVLPLDTSFFCVSCNTFSELFSAQYFIGYSFLFVEFYNYKKEKLLMICSKCKQIRDGRMCSGCRFMGEGGDYCENCGVEKIYMEMINKRDRG